jgi:hypothetical protein
MRKFEVTDNYTGEIVLELNVEKGTLKDLIPSIADSYCDKGIYFTPCISDENVFMSSDDKISIKEVL